MAKGRWWFGQRLTVPEGRKENERRRKGNRKERWGGRKNFCKMNFKFLKPDYIRVQEIS